MRRSLPLTFLGLLLVVIVIAPSAPVSAGDGSFVLRIYDVRDLIGSPVAPNAAGLARRLLEEVEEEAVVEVGKDGGVLIVRTTAATHESIASRLKEIRRQAKAPLILIETRVFQSRRPLLPRKGGSAVRFLDEAQVGRLLRSIEEREDARVITAPRLTCYDRQRADLSILNQISYIADFEIVQGKDGGTAADPVIETVSDGVTLDLKPILSADGKFVTLLLEATVTTLPRPIPTVKIRVEGAEVTIQTPAVTTTTWKRAVTLPAGGHALLDLGSAPGGDGDRLAFLVRASAVIEPEFLREVLEGGDGEGK